MAGVPWQEWLSVALRRITDSFQYGTSQNHQINMAAAAPTTAAVMTMFSVQVILPSYEMLTEG